MSDMRLHVAAANSYFYPDVLVTCSAVDQAQPTVERFGVKPLIGHWHTAAPQQLLQRLSADLGARNADRHAGHPGRFG